jgi:DMSO/TMAO reductase YedYZ molybdopterin-dependent catalytic subunit
LTNLITAFDAARYIWSMNRWRLVAGIAVAAIVVAAVFLLASRGNQGPRVKVTVPQAGTREVTPTDKLHVRTAEGQPQIDPATYRLEVSGLVEHPLSLTFDDVKALPAENRFVKLPCVEGWTDSAVWTGPRLADILKEAGVKDNARTVVFKSPGGYSTSLTVADVMATDPLLAFGVNGGRLPDEQGYPLRLIVPNRLGYKWIKWVTGIQLIKGSYKGYWESSGYSNDADATGR